VIVHISKPIVGNEVVQIDEKPSNTHQRPPVAAVHCLHSEKAVDKVGDVKFHSK
jgi:hypothetical protein